jgi:hypothetical protein
MDPVGRLRRPSHGTVLAVIPLVGPAIGTSTKSAGWMSNICLFFELL